ncbi:MAG: glutathione S-transferase [Gammaproteobacteria bacterium]|nr:glutathione S-transferase [Gammaproteobacteria bacterium]
MKLIGSYSSPYVRKVRMVLAEKGIACKLLPEDVWAADTKIQASNPLGKVPCLILDDGSQLYDSRVICEYLDHLSPANSLIPEEFPQRIQVRRWESLADGILDAAVLIRLEHTQREPAQRSEKWLARQRGKVLAGLGVMESDLGGREWCVAARITLADIALGCGLGWLDFRLPDLDWRADHPSLVRHYQRLSQRPSFASTVPKA